MEHESISRPEHPTVEPWQLADLASKEAAQVVLDARKDLRAVVAARTVNFWKACGINVNSDQAQTRLVAVLEEINAP